MHRVFIALGSNLGNCRENLGLAVSLLSSGPMNVTAVSSVLETKPVDYTDQPNFLNQMIIIETELDPKELLQELQSAEKRLGREKSFPKGPRLIDLDIILYDNIVYTSDELTIPHKERLNRPFIITHLAELEPNLRDPETGELYSNLLHLL